MTETETAWVAGLLEGEGCFHVHWLSHVDGSRYPGFEIRCNMTDEDVVRKLHRTVGMGSVRGPLKKWAQTGNLGKPQWLWRVGRSEDLAGLMTALRPWLGQRRGAKVDLMLAMLNEWPSQRRWRHGTRTGYEVRGCRCDECRASNATRHRERRRRLLERAVVAVLPTP